MDGVVIYTQRGGLLLHGCGVARIQRRGKDTNKAEPPAAPRPRRRRDGTRGQQSRGATRARVVAAVAAMVALGTTALRAAASASPSSTARIR